MTNSRLIKLKKVIIVLLMVFIIFTSGELFGEYKTKVEYTAALVQVIKSYESHIEYWKALGRAYNSQAV